MHLKTFSDAIVMNINDNLVWNYKNVSYARGKRFLVAQVPKQTLRYQKRCCYYGQKKQSFLHTITMRKLQLGLRDLQVNT